MGLIPQVGEGPGPQPDRLVGMAEIAGLADSSRQAITNLRARDQSFPAPIAELRSGPVFREMDVRAYLDGRGRMMRPANSDKALRRRPGKFDPLNLLSLAQSVERTLIEKPLNPFQPLVPFLTAAAFTASTTQDPTSCMHQSRAVRPGSRFTPDTRPHGGRRPAACWHRLISRSCSTVCVITRAFCSKSMTCNSTYSSYRVLVVDDMWAPLAEELLIHHFRPVWNVVVDGFGNHEPGSGRNAQPRSVWDELHPGRPWAARLGPAHLARTEIMNAVATHLRSAGSPHLRSVPYGRTETH